MTDHLLKWMKENHVPVSRAKYLGLAFGNEMPDPWTPEHEAELPEELQEVYSEYGDSVQLDLFDPNEPRDPDGKWTTGGGGGSTELGSGSRAKKGGETAKSNAAFYKGGQFLPSTTLPPGTYKVGKHLLKTRRVLTEPGKLEEMPTPLHRSVYQMAAVGAHTRLVGETGKIEVAPGARYLAHEGGYETYKEVTPEMEVTSFVAQGVGIKSKWTLGELVEKYNKGERWLQLELEEPGTMGSAPHAGGDDMLRLVSHDPRHEQYDRWEIQLAEHEKKLEAAGKIGDREDSQIYQMKNALKEYREAPLDKRDNDSIGISVVYGGPRDSDESNLMAATLVRLDAANRIARVTLSGGIDEAAHEKSLQMMVARYADKADRIEAAVFGDDLESMVVYEHAGFRYGGQTSTGMARMIVGKEGPTQSEQEAAARLAVVRKNEVEARARVAAASLDFNPDNVKFTDEERTFKVNDKEMYYAGSYTRGEPNVVIYHKHIDLASVAGVTAHEIGHRKLDALRERYREEYHGALAEPGPPPDPNGQYWWQKAGGSEAVMSVDGTLRAPYDKKFPVYDFWERNVELKRDQMRKDDGVSAYSKEYWEAFTKLEVGIDKPIHETIAEMTRIKYETGKLPGSPDWKKLHRMIDKVWKELPMERRAEYQEQSKGPFW